MMPDNTHIESGISNDWRNMLYTETRRTGGDPSFLFEILEGILEDRAWDSLLDENGEPVGSLQRLIEAPLPVGIGMPLSRLRQLLQLEHRHEGKSEEWKERMRQLRIAIDKELPKVGRNLNNSKSRPETDKYRLERLKKDVPELADKVVKGELSVTDAYIEAKLAPKRNLVNMENAKSAFNTLVKYMEPEAFNELVDFLNEHRDSQT